MAPQQELQLPRSLWQPRNLRNIQDQTSTLLLLHITVAETLRDTGVFPADEDGYLSSFCQVTRVPTAVLAHIDSPIAYLLLPQSLLQVHRRCLVQQERPTGQQRWEQAGHHRTRRTRLHLEEVVE